MNPSKRPTAANGKLIRSSTFSKLESWMTSMNIQYFSFINTFDHPGDKLSIDDIDHQRLFTLSEEYDKIIALGGFVSRVLDMNNIDHFKMPHPSPLNRLLNDKKFVNTMLNECKEYLK